MAQPATRSDHRDDFDVEARRPSVPAILAWSALAIGLALATVIAIGALVFGR